MKKQYKILLTIQAICLTLISVSIILKPTYYGLGIFGFALGVLVYMFIALPHISYLEKTLDWSFKFSRKIIEELTQARKDYVTLDRQQLEKKLNKRKLKRK